MPSASTAECEPKRPKRPSRRPAEPKASRASQATKACGLQRSRQGLFRAKISFEHIRLYSSYTFRQMAVEYHILLVRLRQLVMMNTQPGATESVSELCEAFSAAFAELEREPVVNMRPRSCLGSQSECHDLNHFLQQYGIRSYLSIHAARWLGSTHVSSPVLPLVDVLKLRHQLLLARSQGWEPFRDAWLGMMRKTESPGRDRATAFEQEATKPCRWGCKKRRRATEALNKAMARQKSQPGLRPRVSGTPGTSGASGPAKDMAVERLKVASCATERALAACNGTRRRGIRSTRRPG